MGHANTNRTGFSKLVTENLKTMNFKISAARYRKLAAHTAANGTTPTTVVREMVEKYIDDLPLDAEKMRS